MSLLLDVRLQYTTPIQDIWYRHDPLVRHNELGLRRYGQGETDAVFAVNGLVAERFEATLTDCHTSVHVSSRQALFKVGELGQAQGGDCDRLVPSRSVGLVAIKTV